MLLLQFPRSLIERLHCPKLYMGQLSRPQYILYRGSLTDSPYVQMFHCTTRDSKPDCNSEVSLLPTGFQILLIDNIIFLQVISSGYIVEDVSEPSGSSKCSRITYMHQLGSTVMPIFSKDILGVSSVMGKLCISLKKFLLNN